MIYYQIILTRLLQDKKKLYSESALHDIHTRTIEILQCTGISYANY